MKVKCTTCDSILRIDDSKFYESTILIACPICQQQMWTTESKSHTEMKSYISVWKKFLVPSFQIWLMIFISLLFILIQLFYFQMEFNQIFLIVIIELVACAFFGGIIYWLVNGYYESKDKPRPLNFLTPYSFTYFIFLLWLSFSPAEEKQNTNSSSSIPNSNTSTNPALNIESSSASLNYLRGKTFYGGNAKLNFDFNGTNAYVYNRINNNILFSGYIEIGGLTGAGWRLILIHDGTGGSQRLQLLLSPDGTLMDNQDLTVFKP